MTNEELLSAATGLITPDDPPLAVLGNLSALIRFEMSDINWCGFYFLHEGELNLGPFCGLPACIRISIGKGVCGTCVAQDVLQCVPDVHQFPGHIACDSQSNSELVLPLHLEDRCIGVLDIDSPIKARFGPDEIALFTHITATLERNVSFRHLQPSLS